MTLRGPGPYHVHGLARSALPVTCVLCDAERVLQAAMRLARVVMTNVRMLRITSTCCTSVLHCIKSVDELHILYAALACGSRACCSWSIPAMP